MTTRAMVLISTTLVACSERRPADPPASPPAPIPIVSIDAATPPRLLLDLVTIDAGPAIVRIGGCPPDPVFENERVERTVDVPAFAISRAPVTCEEFAECVRDGACRSLGPSGVCSSDPAEADAAAETHEQAANYCKWQHARIPTYVELQRAIRGTDGDPFPSGKTFDRHAKCKRSRALWPDYPRCLHRSDAGVIYATRNIKREWTSTIGCVREEDGLVRGPISTGLPQEALWDEVSVFDKAAEFRCAVDR